MTYLPDVSVWVSSVAERHQHHRLAKVWFDGDSGAKLVFCRITQLGFLRLLTNPHVMAEDTCSPQEAWQMYSRLRSDRRVGYVTEPTELAETWPDFTPAQAKSPNLWTDAYLCAFCAAASLTLVTLDAKIQGRSGLSLLKLSRHSS
jgi:toxin-antitoxin system PIN domain toxin